MKVLKNNKKIIILVVMVLIILFIFLIYKILFGGTGAGIYGNRLKGIDKVKLSNDIEEKIKKEIGLNEEVDNVSYKLKGRIVNVIITIKDETPIDRAKEIASKTLEYFDEEEKGYYDFQIFLDSGNAESTIYPLIGYKHNTSEGLVWKQG